MIYDVTEMWSRYSGNEESDDGRITRFTGVRGFQVTHDPDDTVADILADTSLPKIRSLWPNETSVFCRRRNVERVGNVMSQVICEYFGETATASETIYNALPKWTWSNSVTSEPVDIDARGVPFVNSVGDVKEGFTKEISDFTLTVERPFSSINTFVLAPYLDSVNLDFYGSPDGNIWPPGTGALTQFTAQTVQGETGAVYYNVTAKIDFRYPYRTIPARSWWYRYRNDGLNHATTDYTGVTFSGGGATRQASGYVILTAGVVTAVVVTDPGSGYTSTPTVTITGSSGSGATATATVTSGEVTSVSVTGGGSNYKNRIVRATDMNKEPESRPVLLKANGQREYNAKLAIFIERPKKQFILPYSGLGLF